MNLLLLSLLLAAGWFSPPPDEIEVIPVHHGSLILKWKGKVIHIDPWSQGNYQDRPAADLILVTDVHADHMDPEQIAWVSKDDTVVIAPQAVQKTVPQAAVLNNGESTVIMGIRVTAVPMYNLKRGPEPGRLYHTRGRGNGYLIQLGARQVYVSGDTECIPEMKALENIDIAFVCMNLPYTMTPEEAAECVNAFKPGVVYPYHYRGSDLDPFKNRVTAPGVEVRVLDWYQR